MGLNFLADPAKLQFMVFQKLCCEKSEISFWYIRNDIMKDQKDFWYFSDAFHPKAPPTTPFGLLWYVNSSVPKWKLKYKLKRIWFISEKIVSKYLQFLCSPWNHNVLFYLTCNEYGPSDVNSTLLQDVGILFHISGTLHYKQKYQSFYPFHPQKSQ